MTPTYRADIDGLRAIAVLAVLLFHAGLETFSGGFVGVDVFFVISGFLITTIIHREVESGEFSVARFYERRFRRILPAIAVLVVVVLLAGALLFPAHHQDGLARSAVWTALFTSNIFFFLESGYFADPAESMPLLHTWSLAVEEQFYLVFPLVMLLVARFGGRRYTTWLPILALLSLLACVRVTEADASAAFYLGHTRAWELLAGSLLAVNAIPAIRRQATREVAAVAGILLVAISVFSFSELTIFPGLAALLPVVGTALIIHAGTDGETVVSRCLGLRPLVFVGLISYSLYLWHWPVVVFAQYYSVVALSPGSIVLVLATSFVLAVLSWRYIETPFRRKRVAAEPRQMLRLSAVATCALVTAGVLGVYSQGTFESRKPQAVMQFEADDPDWLRWQACERASLELSDGQEPCVIGRDSEPPAFVLWGDSHAVALATALDRSAALHGVASELVVAAGCPPLAGVVREGRRYCEDFNNTVLERLAAQDGIRTVIMAARWPFIVNGYYDRREESGSIRLIDLQASRRNGVDNAEAFATGLRRTLAQLAATGKDVVLVGTVPEVGYDVPSATYVALKTNRDVDALIAPSISEYARRNSVVAAIFDELDDTPAVTVIDPAAYLCETGYCRVAVGTAPLYRDDNHLSTAGSLHLAPIFDVLFDSPERSQVFDTRSGKPDTY